MIARFISALDQRLGAALELGVRTKHRLRLRRVGWAHALDHRDDGDWVCGGAPPRDGNTMQVLIDGDATMLAIADAIEAATESVEIAGWLVDGAFGMPRMHSDGSLRWVPLRSLLAQVAERVEVRVLVWAGFPFGPTALSRPAVRKSARALTVGTKIRCALDPHERPMHCHHEKTVVVDGRVAFVGGVDMTDFEIARADSPAHHPRGAAGWHDVSSRLEGPIVEDVAAHFRMRWHETTGERLATPRSPEPVGGLTLQLQRTIPEKIYRALPNGEFGMLAAYVQALSSARRLIYIENQFIWASEVVEVLAARLRDPPNPDFRVVMVLPTKPASGGDDTRGQLAVLEQADDGAGRLVVCGLQAHGARPDGHVLGATSPGTRPGPDPIYVHAKVCVVDDEWLTVGSTNLNDHSLFNDTEVNVTARDAELARDTRERLWSEHLEMDIRRVRDTDPIELIDTVWQPIAREQLHRSQQRLLPTHRLIRLPGSSRRADRLLGPIEDLLVDG